MIKWRQDEIILEVRIMPGCHIDDAKKQAKEVAKKLEVVVSFIFNNKRYLVDKYED